MLNFKFVRHFSLLIVLSGVLSACTSSPDELERISDRSPQARYQDAKDFINSELYNRAITILNDLESRYPYGPLSRQVQIDLMFAYYKAGRFEEALPAIERFLKLNPNHPQSDFVVYLRGLVNQEKGINGFQEFFGLSNADKDMESSRAAFSDFKKLINKYPNSMYVEDAKKRMVAVLNRLAEHEILVAQYYMRRSSYIAAVNRCKYVVEYYKDSSSVVPALTIMVDAYDKLGLDQMKADAQKVLDANSSN
ncbi:outer membrane protein assembly factor BamD [Psychrosphaera aestuarii]|uniref:outer membrane protein assembly factor BamD n=1 Tax=Psychrosphaera aestuarii TaxID=1266052 RepID=UPI001B320804|nr:outer membrane protein assembly factor BamD [Psychrosphaera aestuarii]